MEGSIGWNGGPRTSLAASSGGGRAEHCPLPLRPCQRRPRPRHL